jgi:aspartate ammonia-lyase
MKNKIYYGAETSKALQNFRLSGKPVDLRFIYALTQVKIALADANKALDRLDARRHQAIVSAAREVLAGKLNTQFVTDTVQGGAGTSINMNVNEVLAARASEILKNHPSVHPLDHVNLGHSTNDALPTAFRLTLLPLIDEYISNLEKLSRSFLKKSRNFRDIIKVGRTHLQDAVPITLGQEFQAYASLLKRDLSRFREFKKYLYSTNLGGTAIGTGLNSSRRFIILGNQNLSRLTGWPFKPSTDLVDSTQNLDVFLHLASLLNLSASCLHKICNDLRLLGSGPRAGLNEIILPEKQNGSSIMPGKVNPVILESVNQIAFIVSGNLQTVTLAVQNGQLELNVMLPVIIKSLLENFDLLIHGTDNLRRNTVDGLLANRQQCQKYFTGHLGKATALIGKIGYDQTAAIVKKAAKNDSSLEEELLRSGLLTSGEMKTVFSPKKMTRPQP